MTFYIADWLDQYEESKYFELVDQRRPQSDSSKEAHKIDHEITEIIDRAYDRYMHSVTAPCYSDADSGL